MDHHYRNVKRQVVNFRLAYCCWFAPIRDSLLVVGYCSFFIALIYLVGSANDSFTPTLKKVQELILGDDATSTFCLFAYAVDAASCVLLLTAVHRRDKYLLSVYLGYKMILTTVSTLLYCSVITASALDVLIKIEIFVGVLIDCYIVLLVWSGLVEIKQKEEEKRKKEIFLALNRGTVNYKPNTVDQATVIIPEAETTIVLNNEVMTNEPTLEIIRETILPTVQRIDESNTNGTGEPIVEAETQHPDETNVVDETPKSPPKRKLRLFRSKDKKKVEVTKPSEEVFKKVGDSQRVLKEEAAKKDAENVETQNREAEAEVINQNQ